MVDAGQPTLRLNGRVQVGMLLLLAPEPDAKRVNVLVGRRGGVERGQHLPDGLPLGGVRDANESVSITDVIVAPWLGSRRPIVFFGWDLLGAREEEKGVVVGVGGLAL